MGEILAMNQQQTIISTEVSEMVERRHDQVLRDIHTIIEHLKGHHKNVGAYFIASVYEDAQRKSRPCFLLTKKGCELYATRMTGAKGTQFAVSYIERFNEMENELRAQQDPVMIALQAAIKTREELTEVKTDVQYLKNTMRIDTVEQYAIREAANKKVLSVIGGKQAPAYKPLKHQVYSQLWRDFKQYFVLPRYPDLPKAKFGQALEFISIWEPDAAVKMEINMLNKQGA